MPDEVFVHQLGGGPDAMLGDAHKPTWLSFASTVSLESLWQWLRPATTHVRVVEALPSRRQHLQADRDGRPRVTEHAAFVRWDRPQARGERGGRGTAATDWWYARAYPGSGDAMDAAAAAVVPWVRARADRLGAAPGTSCATST